MTEIRNLGEQIEKEFLHGILPFWQRLAIDTENGGFYGQITGSNTPNRDARKGLILCTRMLWTFSAAYKRYKNDEYRLVADRAYEHLTASFEDDTHGGYYWMLDAGGRPSVEIKEIYGQSFALYGLAEYAGAAGHEQALERAKALYALIERRAHDERNGGYIESFARDWTDVDATIIGGGQRGRVKSMNTHLHLMEAYTNLLRVWDDPQLRQRLGQLVDLTQQRILNPQSGHLHMYFTDDWIPVDRNVSYGHDIEASWLLVEAAEVLGDERRLIDARRSAIRMADATLAEGTDADGGIWYEKLEDGSFDRNRHWWPQAEALVGFLNAYQIDGAARWLEAASRTWSFIDRYMIDKENGEWYSAVLPDGTPNVKLPKASEWKCPYHNGRACLEAVERLEKIAKQHPTA